MKRNIIRASIIGHSIAIGVLLSGAAFAQSNPAAAGLGGVAISNQIKGGVNVSQIGSSSESSALNTQTATATMQTAVAQGANAAAASFAGNTVQTGKNQVWNSSTGPNASGFASSSDQSLAGTVGAANITGNGIAGGLTAAGYSGVVLSNANFAGTNQGIVTGTNAQTTVSGQIGAQTGGAIAANGNAVSLTGTTTGDVSINTAKGNITLATGGLNGDGSPATTTLSGGSNTVSGTGVFNAGLNGYGAVVTTSGTGAALGDLVNPAIGQLVSLH